MKQAPSSFIDCNSSLLREFIAEIRRENTYEIKRIWVIATIFGSMWGSLEVTLGAFIHNLRIPFGGLLLATMAAFFLTFVARLYPIKGLLIRVGIIAAMCKSLSPGGWIITPMLAIFMESLLAEVVYSVAGVNLFSAVVVGMLLPLWSFFQKIFVSIIFYGKGMVEIYIKLLEKASEIMAAPPIIMVTVMLVLLMLFGIAGTISALVFFHCKRDVLLAFENHPLPHTITQQHLADTVNRQALSPRKRKVLASLFGIVALVSFSSQFLGYFSISLLGMLGLAALVKLYQNAVFLKFINPKFWFFSLLIVGLSGLFLGKNSMYLGGFIPISLQGLREGCSMVIRASILYLLILSFSQLFEINNVFKEIGQEQLGHILKRAFDLLPQFVSIYREELERQANCCGWLSDFLTSVFATAISLINERGLKVIAVVGAKETGKTSAMREIALLGEQNHWVYRAAIQPRILNDRRETVGYRLLFLPDNREINLATKGSSGRALVPKRSAGTEGYVFDKSAFASAREFLTSEAMPDMVLVDEFGKLELNEKGHFSYVFANMHTWGGLWILSMREEYIKNFEQALRVRFAHVLSVSNFFRPV